MFNDPEKTAAAMLAILRGDAKPTSAVLHRAVDQVPVHRIDQELEPLELVLRELDQFRRRLAPHGLSVTVRSSAKRRAYIAAYMRKRRRKREK